jgi:hypothetical protein
LLRQAKLALEDEFDERDLSVIEVRQVDARIEDAAIVVLRVGEYASAQHADLDRVVEQHQIHAGFQRVDRCIVLGRLRNLGIGERDDARLSWALDDRRAEIDLPVRRNSASRCSACRFGLSMACTRCRPHRSSARTWGDEQSLIDLLALFGNLPVQRSLGVDLGAGRQAGPDRGPPPCRRGPPPAAAPCSRWVILSYISAAWRRKNASSHLA